MHIHGAGSGQRSGHEQQRVSGQEWRHHQPGFAEDDQKQDKIDQHPVVFNQPLQMLVEVQYYIDELRNELHGS